MNKNQKGFGLAECILTLLVVSLLSFVGWYLWSKNSSTTNQSTTSNYGGDQQTKKQPEDSSDFSITLISKSTDKPLALTKVSINSDNGTRCAQAPCPANEKLWTATSDKNGVIILPKDYVQSYTTIAPEGYRATNLHYDQTKTTYEMVFDLL